MAIRKRYAGKIRVSEKPVEVFIEGIKISRFERTKKNILDLVREIFDSLISEIKLKPDDIEAFVVANSMGGLFGIPEFMRYVIPSSFGMHKNFFEVNCEDAGGLCAVIKAFDLVKSGLFSRICVISANKINLKNINEIADIVFADVVQNINEFIKEHSREKLTEKVMKDIYGSALSRAKNNPFYHVESKSQDFSNIPKFLDGAGVAIISSGDIAKKKEFKINFVGEKTLPFDDKKDSINVVVSLMKDAFDTLKISPEDISVYEVYDFVPPLAEVIAQSIGLSGAYLSDERINPSGGVFFSCSPPASSFARLFEVVRFLKEKKKGSMGCAISLSTRDFSHSSVVIVEKIK